MHIIFSCHKLGSSHYYLATAGTTDWYCAVQVPLQQREVLPGTVLLPVPVLVLRVPAGSDAEGTLYRYKVPVERGKRAA